MAKIDVAKALLEHIAQLHDEYFETIAAAHHEHAKDILKRLEGYCNSLKEYYRGQI